MDQAMRDLIKKFRQMDDESQQNVIGRVAKRDQEGAELLRKVRRVQKRGDRIENLADEIIDKL
ncbi:hypothetical protein [Salinibacter altiplanensis]|uniref:hypothetical protein n=1 Tax=Salinibacter altiplanensis TaxID=1803181 RepID=UPI000C9F4592|nr:hypothetical protein [Salinibacter altiplanensis]